MKYFKGFITLMLVFLLLNCERDDICAETTSTTPRLLIEFYDVLSTEDLKNVPRLTLYAEDLVTDPTEISAATLIFNSNANSAQLPLRVQEENGNTNVTLRYVLERDTNLRVDDDTTTESNIDILEISYTSELIYVSRACGYKSIFNALTVTRINDGNTWIGTIEVLETATIENENTVHVRILH